MLAILSEVASANPWMILGWLLVVSIVGMGCWAGLAALRDWWRDSTYRRAGS